MSNKLSLLPPVTFQGGKQRLSHLIIDHMAVTNNTIFYDLCCGSGAISLALIESGHDPKDIVMIDAGPWGAFWKAIGEGIFDINKFKLYCDDVPKEREFIKKYIEALHRDPIGNDGIYERAKS